MVRPKIFASGLLRMASIGGGVGRFVLYENVEQPDGSFIQEECGEVIAPLASVPEAVTILLNGLVAAGMNKAANAVRHAMGMSVH